MVAQKGHQGHKSPQNALILITFCEFVHLGAKPLFCVHSFEELKILR